MPYDAWFWPLPPGVMTPGQCVAVLGFCIVLWIRRPWDVMRAPTLAVKVENSVAVLACCFLSGMPPLGGCEGLRLWSTASKIPRSCCPLPVPKEVEDKMEVQDSLPQRLYS